jgi:hypothetical protein
VRQGDASTHTAVRGYDRNYETVTSRTTFTGSPISARIGKSKEMLRGRSGPIQSAIRSPERVGENLKNSSD